MATTGNSWRDYAKLGQAYFIAMIGVELALVMLAAPAATAGAICLDRARGTLAHMLMTDLSDPGDRAGQAGRAAVAGLRPGRLHLARHGDQLAPGWDRPDRADPGVRDHRGRGRARLHDGPGALGLGQEVARSDPGDLYRLHPGPASLADLVFAYRWPGGSARLPPWTLLANPFYVAFAPYADPGKLDFWDYLVFFGVALGASAVVDRARGLADAAGRLPRFGREEQGTANRPDRPDDAMAARSVTRPQSRALARVASFATFALDDGHPRSPHGDDRGPLHRRGRRVLEQRRGSSAARAVWEIAGVCSYVLHVIFGLLMLAAIAPTSMAEERQRGSLDILAATALSTRAIVIGKWLGTFRLVWPMTIGPGLMALAMATARSDSRFARRPGLAARISTG